MSLSILYKNNPKKKNYRGLVLFVDEKFSILGLKKLIPSSEYSYIADLLKTSDLSKNILDFDISSKRRVILISIKKNFTSSDAENLGAKFYNLYKDNKQNEYNLNTDITTDYTKKFILYFLHGLSLKSYKFDKYKTKKNKKNISIICCNICI